MGTQELARETNRRHMARRSGPITLHASPVSDSAKRNRARAGLAAAAIFVVAAVAFLANGRYVGSGDCVPATYLPIALVRGDGPWLDRFTWYLQGPDGRLPGYCELSRGHVVSRYPIGPGLMIAPLVAPQILLADWIMPGWDEKAETLKPTARRMAKNASAVLAAVAMVLLWLWLRSHFSDGASWAATIAASWGTGMWSTAAQAPWQHGPAVFCQTVALCALRFRSDRAWAGVVAGAFTAMIVVCRTVDLPIAAALGVYVVRREPVLRRGFVVAAMTVAVSWSAWNVWFFDHWTGGYAEIEKMHGWAHGVQGSWSTPFFAGFAGTLLSPSHGLLIYSPWVAASVIGVWAMTAGPGRQGIRLPAVLALSLIPTTILLSKYSCWWAGHCYGARFWIDSTPIFAALAAAAWSMAEGWPERRRAAYRGVFVAAVLWSAALQGIGVAAYPTTWHSSPTNADRDHARMWDFRDSEVTRGLKEGAHAREWSGMF